MRAWHTRVFMLHGDHYGTSIDGWIRTPLDARYDPEKAKPTGKWAFFETSSLKRTLKAVGEDRRTLA